LANTKNPAAVPRSVTLCPTESRSRFGTR